MRPGPMRWETSASVSCTAKSSRRRKIKYQKEIELASGFALRAADRFFSLVPQNFWSAKIVLTAEHLEPNSHGLFGMAYSCSNGRIKKTLNTTSVSWQDGKSAEQRRDGYYCTETRRVWREFRIPGQLVNLLFVSMIRHEIDMSPVLGRCSTRIFVGIICNDRQPSEIQMKKLSG